jgi:hypothetical protein
MALVPRHSQIPFPVPLSDDVRSTGQIMLDHIGTQQSVSRNASFYARIRTLK